MRPDVFRLIFVVLVFYDSLFRTMRNFVINVEHNPIFFVGDRSAFNFHLSLLMFNLHDVRLRPVVYQVRFNRRLSFPRTNTIFRVCFASYPTRARDRTSVLHDFRFS